MPRSAFCTLDAFAGSGVEFEPSFGDILAAILAKAVFVLLDAGERGVQAPPLALPASVAGLGHRLILKCVHAAEPADSLLIKFDGGLTRLAAGVLVIERGKPLRDEFTKSCQSLVIHTRHAPDHGIAFCLPHLSAIMKHSGRSMEMVETRAKLAELDPTWARITREAEEMIRDEPLLGGLVHSSILHHGDIESAMAYRMSLKLSSDEMGSQILREICDAAYAADPDIAIAARADIVAVHDRDPACERYVQPLLFFKGFQAIQAYRIAHWLWIEGRRDLARFFQMRVSEVFGVDIHPAARIGKGIMIDHAHSIVIGETATVGDNVSMLHSVTLGGTGKEEEDRHPKIGDGVLIGAGAKVLGNIRVGKCSRVAAGSVVLEEVPPCKTVAGVPARIVGEAGCDQPSVAMDQLLGVR